ncbi:aspartate ammonia-lyase [Acetitomaculum ruminis DSM 5522]|uniref:Aspartate ammonia-lyase n=1 Tax=Acetitomaculum ruminis DSM 5522 TaxID=1120918 RepID=A0A1I0Z966_9FIRM|nr:aspartate ammonia-lyase [Acetitomaculum ruminis]SFB21676.1 aspartate ammonia-lyase [Acetitomaculum ruminis DSM 5522]
MLYQDETKKAMENFPIDETVVHIELIHAIAEIKKAACIAHKKLKEIDEEKADAIIFACDEIIAGHHDKEFVTNHLQGGAGTSTNMNVNEVITSIALSHLGHPVYDHDFIHPLDDVNKSQSTNDIYPTALRIAAIRLIRSLSEECAKLQSALQRREHESYHIKKLGRTELMDAVPVTVGEEFGSYAQAIGRDRWRIYKGEERLRYINLGGTAVGTYSNAGKKYIYLVNDILRDSTGIGLAPAEYPMDLTQNNDVFVEVSGLLKSLATNLFKIANDIRFLSSGPAGGFGEITLAILQKGSSIMPGKINPVIPEMTMQVAMKVMANDYAITMAASNGNFELNSFMPLIADSLLESLKILNSTVKIFREKCIVNLSFNEEHCKKILEESTATATYLTPFLGYDKVNELVLKYNGDMKAIKKDIIDNNLMDRQKLNEILN